MSTVPQPDLAMQRQYLLVSLEEAQATVRAYDTKAQIVGIGYTFALNIVANVIGGLPGAGDEGAVFVVLFWAVVMAPLFFFGYVLYPSRRSAPKVNDDSEKGVERALYIQTARHRTVADLQAAAARADWHAELAYEVLKVSKLREQKRMRFIAALYMTVASFALLAGKQLWSVI
ncbi:MULTISPECIES: hypothetical protein [unclassified Sulfitobacter]|jgi:hypothetical protein|uniref:hypothetical protein n=1 Tax=unclassified Sulfitobacter TaxID=196795 RepID=UPI00159359F8|nr:hypothetical protein [Sulfitobacter sp. HGT1]